MKVLWLVTHPRENPSTRFRALQYVEPLRAHGIEVTLDSLVDSAYYRRMREPGGQASKMLRLLWFSLRRLWTVLTGFRYRAVVILREAHPLGPPVLEWLLCRLNPRLVYDFDDAVYRPFARVGNPLDRWRDFSKPGKVIRWSAQTVAGSATLADYARQHTPRVRVIPTVVDVGSVTPKIHRRTNADAVVGWMGTRNNLLHLALIAPVLADLQVRLGFRLQVVCDRPFSAPGLKVENLSWSEETEAGQLQEFDIGLMPLDDDDYSRGKCAFKIIQYLAHGVPPICSPVGENMRVVRHGETGLLADTPEAWRTALESLLADPDRRQALGARGRALVDRDYSLEAGLRGWLEVFSAWR